MRRTTATSPSSFASAVLAVAVALVLACAAPAAAADPWRRLPGATSRRLLGAGPKLVATCSKRSFKAGALQDVFGTPKLKVEVYQPDSDTGAFAVLKGALGRQYVESYTAINALSGGAFFEPLGLDSHFYMGNCVTAGDPLTRTEPPPAGTGIIPGVTPLNSATTGAHWLQDPSLPYGIRENEMWFTADLPSAGPRGKLPRAGVESEVKEWTFPGTAGCVENPVNRGFQGDLPGSVVIHAVAYDPATAVASRPQWACCSLSYSRRFARFYGDMIAPGSGTVPPPSVRTPEFNEYPPVPFKRESRCRD